MKVRYNAETGLLGKAYPNTMIVPEPYISISKNSLDNIVNQKDKVAFVINNEIVMKEKAALENKKQQLDEVDEKFKQATTDYNIAMNTAIEYSNGFTYFPRYAQETYQGLIMAEMVAKSQGNTTFPRIIKDSTKLANRAVEMSYEELLALTTFLAAKQEEFWAIKAAKESELLIKRAEIEQYEV